MIPGKKQSNKVKLKINTALINESDTVELLGIAIENKLTLNQRINDLYAVLQVRSCMHYVEYENTWLRTRENLYTIASLVTHQFSGCFVGKISI